MQEQDPIILDDKRRSQLDANIRNMIDGGSSNDDVVKYASDFKNQFGSKKKDLSQGSKNTSTVFTKPLQPSQANTPSSNLFGGKPHNEFIGKEREQQVFNQLNKDNPYKNLTTNKTSVKDSFREHQEQFVRDEISNPEFVTNRDREIKAKEDDEFWRNADQLTIGQQLKNSAKNIFTGLKQVVPQLNVASADIWDAVLGKELANDLQTMEGRDIGKVRLDAYKTIEELQKQMLPTTAGITDNIKHLNVSGLMVNLADAVGSLVTTGVPALVTGGGATIPTMIGQSIIDYNNTKAKSKGLSIEQLYSSGQAELKTPLLIGALAGGLELVGLKSVKNVINAGAILKGAGAKKIALYTLEVNKEGMTNLLQGGLDAVNIVKADGGSDEDATDAFFSRLASKQGLDEYLMGVFASGGAGGMSHIVSSIKDVAVKKNVEAKIAEIAQLDQDINNENINQTTKKIIGDQVNKKISEISTEIDDLDNKTDNLSDKDKVKSEELNDKKQELEKVISEPNLSEAGKKVAIEQLVAIDAELGNIKPIVETTPVTTKAKVANVVTETTLADITPIEEVLSKETVKQIENDKLPTNNTQSQVQGEIQPVKNEVVPIKVEDAKTTPIPKIQEVVPLSIEKNTTDIDIEKRMSEIEDKHNGIPSKSKNEADSKEYNSLEKEIEKRERESVFNTTLEKVTDAIDALIQKEKEKPNGYGSFIEKRDARETKEVADRYLNAKKLTDTELKKDFKDALMGNPDTWYADGLKLREAIKEANNRGIDTNDLLDGVTKEFTAAGYDIETARKTVAGMIEPILKGAEKVNTDQNQQITQEADKSNLDLEFIADDSIPKETVDAYNKKGKLAGTTQVPNEKILAKQNEIKTNLETLKKFTKCLTA